jgi:hypothetical protein
LHREGHAVAQHGQMADRVLAQIVGQADLIEQRAVGGKQGQVGAHVGQVQLGAVARIGLDAAIGHDQTAT